MATVMCSKCGHYTRGLATHVCPEVPKAGPDMQHPLPPRPEEVRGATHGDYTRMAVTAQNIKVAMRAGTQWDSLTPEKSEALHMVATKLARIVCGDPDCKDHWDDIAGYARLVSDRIPVAKG